MKITQEVREFARLQEQKATSPLPLAGGAGGGPVEEAPSPDEGMTQMSQRFHDEGGEIYVPAAG